MNFIKIALSTIVLVLIVSVSSTRAQSTQQLKNDSVFALVKQYFNAKQTDQLYALTGEKLKHELPTAAFKAVAEQQLFPLGEIKNTSFISFVNNKISTYKVVFEAVTLQLLMTLDDKDKIELFLFQPYKIPVPDKATVASSNKLLTLLDKRIDTAVKAYILKGNTVGLSIGILRNGRITTYNYGETKRGNDILPTPDNIFEIGSISKTFTATLLAWFVNAGNVKIDDPITKYLPDSVAVNKELQNITLKMLSNHTSGLPRLPGNFEKQIIDPKDPYKDYTKKALFCCLKSIKLNSVPGEKYAYSNLGVGLLGTILARLSGKTYDQLVTEIICRPLKMKSTGEHFDPVLDDHVVTLYDADGSQTPSWNFDALAAAGAIKSSATDLLIWIRANMHPGTDPLSKTMILAHQVTFHKDVQIALGWHIIKVDNTEYFFHDGQTAGGSGFIAFNDDKGLAVVILSNCGESVNQVGINILKRL